MPDDFTPFALIADDDAFIRMDAADILSDAGFRVYEAAGYDEAVEILKDAGENIELLFTDVQMPPSKMDGFDLAHECSKLWPDIRILITSGAKMSLAERELPPNAVFVEKPFNADVICQCLQDLIPDNQKPAQLKKQVSSR